MFKHLNFELMKVYRIPLVMAATSSYSKVFLVKLPRIPNYRPYLKGKVP